MTFILAHELRGPDVTVNTVAPGPTATDMFLAGKDEQTLDRLANSVPLQRLGTPAEIAPRRRVPRQPRRALDQRPDDPGQRRNPLTASFAGRICEGSVSWRRAFLR
jgi:NAD(P)-dependent dehydrogenase (short-subunit alcohol dehydrogenase family)